MSKAIAANPSGELVMHTSVLDDTIDFVWDFGTTPSFSHAEMDGRLETVFSSVARAVERNDRDLLSWLADRLTSLSARLLRGVDVKPVVYFAIYVRALADMSNALSANNAALRSVHADVSRMKSLLPLISALHQSPSSMTASQLAKRLSLKPNNLSPVLRAAVDAGVVTCTPAGRNKYCSITRLGQAYLDAFGRPFRHLVSSRLVDQYWMLAMQAPDSEEAQTTAINANPALTENALRRLYAAAGQVDGEQIAVCDLREKLGFGCNWVVAFQGKTTMKRILGRALASTEILCEVVGIDDNYARFRPLSEVRGVEQFSVPFRLFLRQAVSLREPTAEANVQVHAADFDQIKEAADSAGLQVCAVQA